MDSRSEETDELKPNPNKPAAKFKGKAVLVADVSPFDLGSTSGNLSSALFSGGDLFPSATSTSSNKSVFDSLPNSSLSTKMPIKPAEITFSKPPTDIISNISTSKSASNTADDLFSQAPPSAIKVVSKKATALDIFSSSAPSSNSTRPDWSNITPPIAPGVSATILTPLPPGVKAPPPQTNSIENNKTTCANLSLNDSNTEETSSKIPSKSSKSNKQPQYRPNTIPTPHGFVSIPTPFPNTVQTAETSVLPMGLEPRTDITTGQEGVNLPAPRPRKYIKPVSSIATFGFGGCIATMIPLRSFCPPVYQSSTSKFDNPLSRVPLIAAQPSRLKIYRLIDIVNADSPEVRIYKSLLTAFPCPDEQTHNFSNLLNFSSTRVNDPSRKYLSDAYFDSLVKNLQQDGDHNYLSRSVFEENESILWEALGVLLNRFSAGEPVDSSLLELLSRPSTVNVNSSTKATQAYYEAHRRGNSQQYPASSDYLLNIENMLKLGHREKALEEALAAGDWSFALLLASVIGPDAYRRSVRLYSESQFPSNSTLRLLSMAFSNQGTSALEKEMSGKGSECRSFILSDWRSKAMSLYANRLPEWEELLVTLGEQLEALSGDVMLQQLPLLLTERFPLRKPKELHKDACMLGCAPSNTRVAVMADCVSLSSLRMSQLFEKALYALVHSKSKADTSTKTASSLLSWMSLSSSQSTQQSSSSSSSSALPSGVESSAINYEKWARYSHFLIPMKVRLSMSLCDVGLTDDALSYLRAVHKYVRDISDPQSKLRTRLGEQLHLSKRLLKALDEFGERLSIHKNISNTGQSSSSAPSKASSSFWNLASLMDFVDGSSAASAPPVGNKLNQSAQGKLGIPQADAISTSTNFSASTNSLKYNNADNYSSPATQSTLLTVPLPSNIAPPPITRAGNLEKQQLQLPQPPQLQQQPQLQLQPPQLQQHQQQQQQQQQQQHQQQQQQQSSPQPDSKPKDQVQSSQSQPSSKATKKAEEQLSAPTKGIAGALRKGVLQWFYPDAHDASENIGQSLDAYYDNALGRWVFPGEDPAASNPALKPPPTGPSGPSGPSPAASNVPTAAATQSAISTSASGDALSALMAPPSRINPATSSSDPLAALMAPPPSRFAYPPSAAPSNSNADGVMPTPSAAPRVSVWCPPPAPVSRVSSFVVPPSPLLATDIIENKNEDTLVQQENEANTGIGLDISASNPIAPVVEQAPAAPTQSFVETPSLALDMVSLDI